MGKLAKLTNLAKLFLFSGAPTPQPRSENGWLNTTVPATMVNINIELPDDLHKPLKLAALLKDETLKEYVIAAIEAAVRESPTPPFSIKPESGTGLPDRASLPGGGRRG